jgi:S-adenosylmethionine synthetase
MPAQLYPAEAVLPGHPDKLCDAIADALVEEAARRQRRALCGVEVGVHRSAVFVTGRIAGEGAEGIPVEEIVRRVYAEVGYGAEWGPAPEGLAIHRDLCLGPLHEGEAEFRAVADDQCIVTGYAVDLPGTNYLPAEQWLAQRLVRRLTRLRAEAPELRLGPDGKLIVLLEEDRFPTRLAGCSVSLQQAAAGPVLPLHRAVRSALGEELNELARRVPGFDPRLPDAIAVNGAGDFVLGGPEGDNGLSGKKLVMDAYGPRVPIGGGALSGKDFYKADRAGALSARRLAKAVVLTGAAQECVAVLAFVPGAREAQVLSLHGDGQLLDASRWAPLLDRTLAGAGDRWTGRAALVDVARHGHFTLPERPWEHLHFDDRGGEKMNHPT